MFRVFWALTQLLLIQYLSRGRFVRGETVPMPRWLDLVGIVGAGESRTPSPPRTDSLLAEVAS